MSALGGTGAMPTPKRALYDRFAWAYDLVVERPAGPEVGAVADVLAREGLARGATVVDAGCGTGAYAVGLALRGFAVTAVDQSPELLVQARRRAREAAVGATFACADFTRGWRPAHPADGVVCRGVLNDLLDDGDRARAFVSFAAWLRPGGVLLVDVRDRASSQRRYAGGRTLQRRPCRGEDILTFTSTTTMEPGSDLLRLVERWSGTAGGESIEEEGCFAMRCWTWDALREAALDAGFRRISALDPDVVGARGDRLVAVARR